MQEEAGKEGEEAATRRKGRREKACVSRDSKKQSGAKATSSRGPEPPARPSPLPLRPVWECGKHRGTAGK